ncbi:MAG: hypothetical protein AAFV43_13665 [Planctomycetota bacterium]
MQITLPTDLANRLLARSAEDEITVIRQALDALDAQDEELRAIQEGIEDWRAGRVQDFDEFDREFRAKNSMPADS